MTTETGAGTTEIGAAVLDGAAIEALLRECVTVVEPGQVLIGRVPFSFSQKDLRLAQEWLDARTEHLGFSALAIPCEGLGVMEIASGLGHVLGPGA